jgi:hypothetical protein
VSCDHQFHVRTTDNEVEAARDALISALDASWDDETASERIIAAMNRLRVAQARQTAARTGLAHLPDLVGKG